MIIEVAEITVKPGDEFAFEAGFASAAPLFLRAKGRHRVSLHRAIENPSVYRLLVNWETVDSHMVDFRNSESFQERRRIVSPYFNGPPSVTHS